VIYLALLVGGLLVGLVLGRWWALGVAAVPGIFVALVSEVDEVPGWYLGIVYAVIAAFGIAGGVLARKVPARR
jgi:hypothetical protein